MKSFGFLAKYTPYFRFKVRPVVSAEEAIEVMKKIIEATKK